MTTPQKSAVLVIFLSGGGYLTKRFSGGCNVKIFFLFAVLYLILPGQSAEAAGELHGSGNSIPFIWPKLLGKHF